MQGEDDDIEALERDISEESGWKLVHGDVFRPPPQLPVLCALVGTGVQLALLVLATILITIAGTFKAPVDWLEWLEVADNTTIWCFGGC